LTSSNNKQQNIVNTRTLSGFKFLQHLASHIFFLANVAAATVTDWRPALIVASLLRAALEEGNCVISSAACLPKGIARSQSSLCFFAQKSDQTSPTLVHELGCCILPHASGSE